MNDFKNEGFGKEIRSCFLNIFALGGLANQHMREGIVATCFNEGLAKFHAYKLLSFGDKLIDWRWASAISFCKKIDRLEQPLCQYWDPKKYKDRRDRQRETDDDENFVSVQTFSAAVQDHFMWAYAATLRSLLDVVNGMVIWSEWCSCHTIPDLHRADDRHPDRDLPDPLHDKRCPFAGRRAPEMAAGALRDFIDSAAGQNAASLLLDLQNRQHLQESKRHQLMQEFNRGIEHMLYLMAIKFAFWTEIPYKLCAISHWREDTAREAARECLRQWDRAQRLAQRCREEGSRPLKPHHWSTMILGESGTLRRQLLLFVDGASRSDDRLKELRGVLCKVLFVPVVERGIEGRHSILKRILLRCPHYSGALASLNMRIKGLRHYLSTSPEFLQELIANMDMCRDTYYLLRHLGMSEHPSVPVGLKPGSDHHVPLVTKIVYRHDLRTQFDRLAGLELCLADDDDHGDDIRHMLADVEDGGGDECEGAIVGAAEPNRVDHIGLMRHYALAHFKEVVTKNDFVAAVSRQAAFVSGVYEGIRTLLSFQNAEDRRLRGGHVAILDDDGGEMRFEREHRSQPLKALPVAAFTDYAKFGGAESQTALFFRIESFQPKWRDGVCLKHSQAKTLPSQPSKVRSTWQIKRRRSSMRSPFTASTRTTLC